MNPRLSAVVAIVYALGIPAAPASAPSATNARHVLEDHLSLSPAELDTLDRGRTVVKSLEPGDNREVAAAGAVRVEVPVEFFVSQVVDIVAFKQHRAVKQIGKFSDPPRPDDLEGLTIDQVDLDALRKCRIGNCDLNLSASQITRLQTGIDWSRRDARLRATETLRALLLEYVTNYRAVGNDALIVYDNDGQSVRAGDELRSLVAHSSQLFTRTPALAEALLTGSSPPLPRTEQFIYWSKEQFGLKPVISITHVIVHRPGRKRAADMVMTSKQIYASRYFAGSLAVTLGIEADRDPSCSSFYMVYANRSRPIELPPLIGRLARRIVQSQTRSGLEENLIRTKVKLEQAYQQR